MEDILLQFIKMAKSVQIQVDVIQTIERFAVYLASICSLDCIGYTHSTTLCHTENCQRGAFPSELFFFSIAGSKNTTNFSVKCPDIVTAVQEQIYYSLLVGFKVFVHV